MPKTGNKFNDLYELSKNIRQIKQNNDKTTEEYEYDKNR
jgi:hypothetical protein